ncbi:MAG: hypothetical protein F4W90_03610 [Gammaproteobacteria bacterium]|nr:hypothetical protein [Gammaproteobacteria bacterium]
MWSLLINDIQLRLQRDSELVYDEPGIAYATDQETLFGYQALAQHFIHPVQCHSTFWQRMNDAAMDQRTKKVGKYSDLVYNQIIKIFEGSQVQREDSGWVLVPSDLDEDQVGLLYGILDYKGIKPRGFVDVACVASAKSAISNNTFFVDLHLERTVVTQLNPHEGEIKVVDVKTVPNTGYLHLAKRWIDTVAQQSLEESRFDPRVSGDTEQQVFERLRERLHSEEIVIAVEHNGEIRSTNVLKSTLAQNSIDVYERIVAECAAEAHVLLGQHAANLPGFSDFITTSGRSVEQCQSGSSIAAIAELDNQLPEGSDVDLFKSFKSSQANEAASQIASNRIDLATANTSRSMVPTHVLINDEAHAIGSHFDVYLNGVALCNVKLLNNVLVLNSLASVETKVNNRLVLGDTAVQNGDRITFSINDEATKEIVLIRVAEHG